MTSSLKKSFFKRIQGPVFPIPTPFKKDGGLDVGSLQRYTSYLLSEGAKTLMVTVGTSRFDVLTVDEMKKVNKVVVDTVAGKALTIVTTPSCGPTRQAIEFARHAAEIGADGILAVFPDRYYDDDDIFTFFKDIALSTDIGVLIHLMPIRAGRAGTGPWVQYPPDLLEKIGDIDNIVGIKEESHDQGLVYKYNRALRGKLLIIGGAGGMRAYLNAHLLLQPAYLVGIGNIVPELEMNYFHALMAGDLKTARQIVFEKEEPFFELAVKIGWHKALKEALSIKGLMPSWERPPMQCVKPTESDAIAEVMEKTGLF